MRSKQAAYRGDHAGGGGGAALRGPAVWQGGPACAWQEPTAGGPGVLMAHAAAGRQRRMQGNGRAGRGAGVLRVPRVWQAPARLSQEGTGRARLLTAQRPPRAGRRRPECSILFSAQNKCRGAGCSTSPGVRHKAGGVGGRKAPSGRGIVTAGAPSTRARGAAGGCGRAAAALAKSVRAAPACALRDPCVHSLKFRRHFLIKTGWVSSQSAAAAGAAGSDGGAATARGRRATETTKPKRHARLAWRRPDSRVVQTLRRIRSG